MDVTRYIAQLESLGFTEELLDRAVAAAGANRFFYQALFQAVKEQGCSPEQALALLREKDCGV